jgi:hypothetical protein
LQQIFNCQWLGGAVVLCHVVQHIDGFLVPSLTDQVTGAFAKAEDEEAQKEGEQRDGAHRVHQISPSHVVLLLALSRRRVLAAGEMAEKSPSRSRRDKLAE